MSDRPVVADGSMQYPNRHLMELETDIPSSTRPMTIFMSCLRNQLVPSFEVPCVFFAPERPRARPSGPVLLSLSLLLILHIFRTALMRPGSSSILTGLLEKVICTTRPCTSDNLCTFFLCPFALQLFSSHLPFLPDDEPLESWWASLSLDL
jgi:hypothetical protein